LVNISHHKTESALFEIWNAEGQLVRRFAMHLQAGTNAIEKDVSTLAAGVYVLIVRTSAGMPGLRFMKR
jgi:hypothetical protein